MGDSVLAGDGRMVKGTNPQMLVEKIVRQRIFECKYWKEHCYALTGRYLPSVAPRGLCRRWVLIHSWALSSLARVPSGDGD